MQENYTTPLHVNKYGRYLHVVTKEFMPSNQKYDMVVMTILRRLSVRPYIKAIH